jgi:hypothetical protein
LNDRRYLGQRYATSKISNFEDIDSVRSYGFRGEAIASLCNIGDLSITTCIDGDAAATTLQFDRTGSLISYVLVQVILMKGRRSTPDKEGRLLLCEICFEIYQYVLPSRENSEYLWER